MFKINLKKKKVCICLRMKTDEDESVKMKKKKEKKMRTIYKKDTTMLKANVDRPRTKQKRRQLKKNEGKIASKG